MTITLDRHTQLFVVTCDECPEHIETECDDWNEAKDLATNAGWRTFKGPDKQWANACPVCVAEFARTR